ncbi:MAG TPA: ribonuclease P protein component [Bacteroidales bacterium]|nr:ribonuclease P protein component [Bacteroidales bacterium]
MATTKFSKKERLKSQKKIHHLFESGNQFNHFPFRIIWQFEEQYNPLLCAQIGISVSKRKIKEAVQRNHIKRKIKEIYRKNKNLICNPLNDFKQSIYFMVIYNSTDDLNYTEMKNELLKAFSKMIKQLKSRANE